VKVPAPRPGSVTRTALVNRLRAARGLPVVTLVAPAGYGKTTALAQWAGRDGRPFAWLSLDTHDDDPAVLVRDVTGALEGRVPVPGPPARAHRAPWRSALSSLASALASAESPFVLVLDGVSALRSKEAAEVVATIAEHVPDGSTLALAGRLAPPLPLPALRARGRLLELGPALLALSPREAERLLEASGVELTGGQVAALVERTEGWAAGLYLAALAIRDGGGRDPDAFTGDDLYLADFFASECLATVAPARRGFLRRTSVLEWLSGPICDAVLETEGSATALRLLEEEGLFVVPLDRRRERYRYHGLFRDALRRELEQHEPELVPALHARGADWLEAHSDLDAAAAHAAEAGDGGRLARVVAAQARAASRPAEFAAAERRLELFDVDGLERHTEVALAGAWLHAVRGRAADAELCLAAAERSADAPSLSLLRAALCREGAGRMLEDAVAAAGGLSPADCRHPASLLLLGVAEALAGRTAVADATLEQATEEADAHRDASVAGAALAERALLASARDEHEVADRLALAAGAAAAHDRAPASAPAALVAAVAARALLRHGRWPEAQAELAAAERLEPALTHALPWLAAQTRLELAEAYLTLRDTDRAGTLVASADAILRRRPGLDALSERAGRLRLRVDAQHAARPGRDSALTGAELRLLPLLATHLSFREIGARLYVSRNTIKTQAISVYRKLGVSSRSDAIDRAAALGLLDAAASAMRAPTDAAASS
jgi:LuxR family maltose regulon positive regulatory protein